MRDAGKTVHNTRGTGPPAARVRIVVAPGVVVPVRVAGAPEHFARAHRRVPPRRAPAPRRIRRRRGHVVGGGRSHGARAAAQGTVAAAATAAAPSAQGRRRRRHEEVRVRVVRRRAARARQADAGVPDEHAQPQVAGPAGTSAPSARRHRTDTRGTLTDTRPIAAHAAAMSFTARTTRRGLWGLSAPLRPYISL